MTFSNKVYDRMKWIAQYLLPALGTLYFALSSIWGLPYAEQVVGTISAVDVFLGVMLGISTANYAGDGVVGVDKNGLFMDVDEDKLKELSEQSMITLKVDGNLSDAFEGGEPV